LLVVVWPKKTDQSKKEKGTRNETKRRARGRSKKGGGEEVA